jgi:hypothetical protein
LCLTNFYKYYYQNYAAFDKLVFTVLST